MQPNLPRFSAIFLIILFGLNATAQDSAVVGKYCKLYSNILGGEISYIEHLPDGYDKSTTTYPVVYLMNAQSMTNFANACATVDNLASERIPDVILIGICNTGVAENQWACPDDSGHMASADNFNHFLEQELIPEINKNYRTNNFNILAGQSNRSLFVLNNMMHNPELFKAFVVVSPMLGWCPAFQTDEMTRFLDNNRELHQKLYINYGELDYLEVLNHIANYEKLLEQNAPAGLEWKVEKIINDGHVPYMSLHNALLFFFSGCTFTTALQKSSVADIKAHYEKISKDYGFTVFPKGDALMSLAWDMKEQKNFDRSVELYEYLVSLYPGNAIYLGTYGITLYKKGDLKGAREKAMAALAIDPGQPHAKAVLEKLDKPEVPAALPAQKITSAKLSDSANFPSPKVDKRVELLSIVFRLAGNREYNDEQYKQYTADIHSHFDQYKEHELITFARSLRNKNGVSYDAVMKMAIHLSEPPALNPLIAFSKDIPERRWGVDDATKFVNLLQKFYTDARCDEFFKAHDQLYRTIPERFKKVYDVIDISWYPQFYGVQPGGSFIVILGLGNGCGNYGPKITYPDGREDNYAIMGVCPLDSLGKPEYNVADNLPTLIHEFNHSFVNQLISKYKSSFEDSGEKLYGIVKESMRRQAYGNWQTMLNESLVRASVIRYYMKHDPGGAVAKARMITEYNNGFFWISELVDCLGDYEASRDKYPTLESYMPVLAGFYAGIAKSTGAMFEIKK